MKVTYDPLKNQRNIIGRGLSFELVTDLDWTTAQYFVDTRYDYPENRYIAYGQLAQRLHVVVFTEVEVGIRVISFRKANTREVKRYEQATTD